MEQNKILKQLNCKQGVTLKALMKKLQVDKETLLNMLEKLETELKVTHKKNGMYFKTEDEHHVTGVLSMSTRGFGFVVTDTGKRIFIPANELNGAMEQDRILVETKVQYDGRMAGRVLKVNSKKHEHVGLVYEKDGNYYVKLDNRKFHDPVLLKDLGGAYIDNKVLVQVDKEKEGHYHTGKIIEVLGHKNDPRVDVLSIIREFEIPAQFPKEVIKEISEIPTEVTEEEIKGRLDLREEEIFTIDGDDAKDFDDAVSLKKLENGNYRLGVHIADVSYYVKEGSAIDKEAFKRCTSTYTPGYVTPMLPHKLSNGICSLNPNVDRLTVSCFMEYDKDGNIVDGDIALGVIRSQKRMTYKNVNQVLNGNIIEGYEPHVQTLNQMLELSKILRKRMEQNGMIHFDSGEMVIKTNDLGVPIDITASDRGEAEKLIEVFMIAKNEFVASYFANLNIPFIYRVHPEPDEEKMEEFLENMNKLGIDMNLSLKRGMISSKQLQEELNKYQDHENYDIITNMMLRSLKKAMYSNENLHHYALALRNYTHFTSPIRRYPDLTAHRALKELIRGNYNPSKFNALEQKYSKIAEQSSLCERRSEECEREVEKMKAAEYLEDKIGSSYDGKITGMRPDNKRVYVTLENLIHGSIDGATKYDFDEEHLRFTSMNHRIYTLGSKVKLVLTKADKENRIIEFDIDEDTLLETKQKVLKKTK